MKPTNILFGVFLFMALVLSPVTNFVYAQSSKKDAEKSVKKVSGLKKDFQKIKKILSFKKNLKHHDSVKLARKFIHEQHKLLRERNYPYKLNKEGIKATINKLALNTDFELGYEVLGWYPFWEKDLYKSLDYKLLSTIAYFAYEVNPKNGEAKSIHDWNTTPLLDSAKLNGKKILLTASNFGNSNNRKLLKSTKSTNTLINNLVKLISDKGAHGVCIDFEGIAKAERNDFSSFISLLKQKLKASNPSFQLYVTLPSVDWQEYLDFETITSFVDTFVIMGYDYYGQTSEVAGPVSPKESGKIWEPYNLEVSVDFYLANGVPNNKLMLALPFYGSIWETQDGNKPSKSKKYVGSRTYDYIKANITSPIKYDTVSKSAWSAYAVQDGDAPFRQVWFDDKNSFSVKLNYLKQKKLKGLGVWALGYNSINKELWDAVATNLVKSSGDNSNGSNNGDGTNTDDSNNTSNSDNTDPSSSTTDPDNPSTGGTNPDPSDPDSKTAGTAQKSLIKKLTDIEAILNTVTKHKTVLMLIMLMVVIFGGIGFVIAMFKPDTRAYFFSNTAHTVYYCFVIICCLLVLLRWNHIIEDLSVVLIIGFIMGAVSGYLVYKIIDQIEKEKP